MNSHLQYIIKKCREKLGQDIVLASNDSWQERIDKENHNSEAREIHFRPITLQDILLAMGRDVILAGNGDIYKSYRDFEYGIIGTEYDLTKSPYDQREEVLEFISKNI